MDDMAYDSGNIFAKILRGEASAHRVLDEEHCIAFMDLMPQAPGHTLVIPREPAENLFELSDAGLSHLILATKRVARAVRSAFNPPGIMIAQLNGAEAGQSVFHIHFHVIPREDGVAMPLHAHTIADATQLAEHAARIRAELQSA